MPDYLSKEEIKQWRSSLEKITLEEYAARLGKVLEEEKQTNDLIDIVMHNQSKVTYNSESSYERKIEKLNSIANKAFEREKEISSNNIAGKIAGTAKKDSINKNIPLELPSTVEKEDISLKEKVNITFSKALTEREQLVFNHFLQNKGKIVYAKELAALLSLPRDYVYKYIKNLRAKIDGEKLENAENGGYILNV